MERADVPNILYTLSLHCNICTLYMMPDECHKTFYIMSNAFGILSNNDLLTLCNQRVDFTVNGGGVWT